MNCLDCGHAYAQHRIGINGRECITDGPRCFCKRYNDGSPRPLSLYTREEVVALIREAMAPQNRYAQVDAILDAHEALTSISEGEFLTNLRAALHVERGTR